LVTFHWLCFFQSIKVSTISVAVVCLATSSLFSALIEPIFFKRKLLKYEVFMGIVVIAALIFILGAETQYLWGYFYGIMAAFLGTLFTLFNAKYIKKVGAAKITMIEMLAPWKKSYDQTRQHIKKQRHYFAVKCSSSQSYGFYCSHIWM